MKEETNISRKRMIELLNEDLAREYQAIIAYIIYSQTIKGAQYNHIAQELEKHAGEELQHAISIAKQIDYLNGEPTNKPKEVKVSDDPKKMLQFDLENERQTLINYRQRIRQADAMGVCSRRSFARNHRAGTGTFAGPGRRARDRYSQVGLGKIVCRLA
jgi:bacterioferritin